jgi:hypothetical protein
MQIIVCAHVKYVSAKNNILFCNHLQDKAFRHSHQSHRQSGLYIVDGSERNQHAQSNRMSDSCTSTIDAMKYCCTTSLHFASLHCVANEKARRMHTDCCEHLLQQLVLAVPGL